MRIQITLKNYRCFSTESPARFEISEGFTASLVRLWWCVSASLVCVSGVRSTFLVRLWGRCVSGCVSGVRLDLPDYCGHL